MKFLFFNTSVFAALILFLICALYKRPSLRTILIGITSVGYTLLFEIVFGERLHLYYYIHPNLSTYYIVLSGLLLYPIVNMIYIMFLPEKLKPVLLYTATWIAGMLLFEHASVRAGTVVFTGWKPIPWSIVTYIITYTWIYVFYEFLHKRIHDKPQSV